MDSLHLNLGSHAKYVWNSWSIVFHPFKLLLMTFTILFKILLAHYVFQDKNWNNCSHGMKSIAKSLFLNLKRSDDDQASLGWSWSVWCPKSRASHNLIFVVSSRKSIKISCHIIADLFEGSSRAAQKLVSNYHLHKASASFLSLNRCAACSLGWTAKALSWLKVKFQSSMYS